MLRYTLYLLLFCFSFSLSAQSYNKIKQIDVLNVAYWIPSGLDTLKKYQKVERIEVLKDQTFFGQTFPQYVALHLQSDLPNVKKAIILEFRYKKSGKLLVRKLETLSNYRPSSNVSASRVNRSIQFGLSMFGFIGMPMGSGQQSDRMSTFLKGMYVNYSEFDFKKTVRPKIEFLRDAIVEGMRSEESKELHIAARELQKNWKQEKTRPNDLGIENKEIRLKVEQEAKSWKVGDEICLQSVKEWADLDYHSGTKAIITGFQPNGNRIGLRILTAGPYSKYSLYQLKAGDRIYIDHSPMSGNMYWKKCN
jgi:hypothetical protein